RPRALHWAVASPRRRGRRGRSGMRLDVYRGTTLAASLAYRRAPVYHGALGARVRALLAAPRRVHNPWVGAWADAPRADSPAWWLAGILGAGLGRAGFAIAATGAPLLYTRAASARRGRRRPGEPDDAGEQLGEGEGLEEDRHPRGGERVQPDRPLGRGARRAEQDGDRRRARVAP